MHFDIKSEEILCVVFLLMKIKHLLFQSILTENKISLLEIENQC